MDAITLLKEELQSAREAFEGTVSTIAEKDLHKTPGGKALPLSALWAHLVLSEDMTVCQFLEGKQALFETEWKDKTGVSEMMPAMDQNWSKNNEEWSHRVQLDLSAFREYEKAVYTQTERYLNELQPEDLEREVDMGSWGKKTVAYFLYAFIIGHIFSLTGEISAIKGVHGAKGYAF